MQKPLTIFARVLLVLFVLAMLPSLLIVHFGIDVSAGSAGHPCEGDNLIPNCGFDQFVSVAQGEAPAGWTPYVLRGSLAMDPSPDTAFGAPSLRMWSDGDIFLAGIYTQVGGVTPGATYSASMGWGAPAEPKDSFSRRLGIDPTGGTDPNSASIVWGPEWRGAGKVMNDVDPGAPNITVSAVARNSTVTVFLKVDHNYSTGKNEIFVDAIGLHPSTAPVVPVATNAPTPAPVATKAPAAPPAKPAAAAPTKRPPTATPTKTRTPSPAPSATPAPTDTPSATPTATLTPTPTETLTPSVTPSSTLPARPRATAAPVASEATQVASTTQPPQMLLFGGVGALLGAGLIGILFIARRRK